MLFLPNTHHDTSKSQYNGGLKLKEVQDILFVDSNTEKSPKVKKWKETRYYWNLMSLIAVTTTNIRHFLSPNHILTQILVIKTYLSQYLLSIKHIQLSEKIQTMPKTRKDTLWRHKAIIRTKLNYDTNVRIIKQGIKNS